MTQPELTISEKIEKVNAILLAGEPQNVTEDTLTHYVGYKPQYIIDAMNEVFTAGEWGYNKISLDERETLIITEVEVFLPGITYKPTAYGQGRITRGDIGDACKSAITDAIKKALAYFSIGNRAYRGELVAPPKQNPQQQNRNQQQTRNQQQSKPTPQSDPQPAPVATQSQATSTEPLHETTTLVPSGSELLARVNAMQLDWDTVVTKAFNKVAEKIRPDDPQGYINQIKELGTELSPEQCKRVCAYLEYIQKDKAKKVA